MKCSKKHSAMPFVILRQNKKPELSLRHEGFHNRRRAPLGPAGEENGEGDGFCSVALRLGCLRRHSSLPVILFFSTPLVVCQEALLARCVCGPVAAAAAPFTTLKATEIEAANQSLGQVCRFERALLRKNQGASVTMTTSWL